MKSKLALILVILAGCSSESKHVFRVRQYHKYEMSAEKDKIYTKKVEEWIDDHFNDPQKIEWKEKTYSYCEAVIFEAVRMDATFRLTDSQGVRTLHKVQFSFGGPTRIEKRQPRT